ncbi:hypothetical protein T03_3770 [Trichinella britovi]|uniref:Uncharacterized protein n=1 Tax=Trichinella britovi TaxID=45882 RepID=A0A0V1DIF9_TRIBR|nr:hypothetical protein T03_3770 [Trichinella britovi]
MRKQNCEAVVLELFSNIEQPPVGSAESSNQRDCREVGIEKMSKSRKEDIFNTVQIPVTAIEKTTILQHCFSSCTTS